MCDSTSLTACPHCSLLQRTTPGSPGEVDYCRRCGTPLVRRAGKCLRVALALSATTLLFLIPALFEPFLTTSALGAVRTSTLPSSATDLWRTDRPVLGTLVLLFVIVLPLIRFAALTLVLGVIHARMRPRWLKHAFRAANSLETWAMLDVFLLAAVVAYMRLDASILVTAETGALCFAGAAVSSLATRAALDRRQAWRRIAPGVAGCDAPSSIECRSCELLVAARAEGRGCPRCGAAVWRRRPYDLMQSMAMLAAAALLYLPANLLPIATIPIDFKPTAYTVLGGIVDLAKSHMFGLAMLVFCASFAIPILKIVGLSWCALSRVRRSNRRLIGKTRVYRVIEEIGRWSMVDPFTIACFAPVMHFNALVDGRAEAAALPFAAVVIFTTCAVKIFDPRRMWDRAASTP